MGHKSQICFSITKILFSKMICFRAYVNCFGEDVEIKDSGEAYYFIWDKVSWSDTFDLVGCFNSLIKDNPGDCSLFVIGEDWNDNYHSGSENHNIIVEKVFNMPYAEDIDTKNFLNQD